MMYQIITIHKESEEERKKRVGGVTMNVKLEIEFPEGKRIIILKEGEGVIFEDRAKKDEFSLDWNEVWDACDNWRD